MISENATEMKIRRRKNLQYKREKYQKGTIIHDKRSNIFILTHIPFLCDEMLKFLKRFKY